MTSNVKPYLELGSVADLLRQIERSTGLLVQACPDLTITYQCMAAIKLSP